MSSVVNKYQWYHHGVYGVVICTAEAAAPLVSILVDCTAVETQTMMNLNALIYHISIITANQFDP